MKNLLLLLAGLLALGAPAAAQAPTDSSVLRLWRHPDKSFNAPGNGNPLLPGYYADPTIIEDRGTYYLYATSDLTDWTGINRLAAWTSSDFVHWQCRYLNWPTKAACTSPTSTSAGVWAPSVVKAPNGKFYMYVAVGEEIWVGVADAPLGPWRNARPDGQPLVRHKAFYFVQTIDAECFIDDDGQAYLYWGSAYSGYDVEGRCLAVKLKPDMISFDGEPRDVTPPHYFEAPYMHKRNGQYYFSYSWGHTWDETYQVRYATGPTPFGPWTEGMMRPILGTNEKDQTIKSTGHHTLLQAPDGNTYIIYHRFNTVNDYDISAKLRQVCADPLRYNPDGSIQRVVTTHVGVGPLGPTAAKRPNLAARAPATSSADLSPKTRASYATDENNGTLWIGRPGPTAWLTVDLGAVRPIREVAFYPEFPIYSYDYQILTSADNRTWQPAPTSTSTSTSTSASLPASPLSVTLPAPTKVRYVRVQLNERKNGPRPGIWEVEIH